MLEKEEEEEEFSRGSDDSKCVRREILESECWSESLEVAEGAV